MIMFLTHLCPTIYAHLCPFNPFMPHRIITDSSDPSWGQSKFLRISQNEIRNSKASNCESNCEFRKRIQIRTFESRFVLRSEFRINCAISKPVSKFRSKFAKRCAIRRKFVPEVFQWYKYFEGSFYCTYT